MEHSNDQQTVLTVDEVADHLKISPWTVRRMISRGELRAVRYGRTIRIDPKDLAKAGKVIPAAGEVAA